MKLNKRTFTFIRDLGVTEESFRLEKVQDTIFVDRIHVSQPLLTKCKALLTYFTCDFDKSFKRNIFEGLCDYPN